MASREKGQEYGHPLQGDRSVGQLAKYIAKSMPDDDPGSCEGEDAEKVAAYIYDAFYSKTGPGAEQAGADRAVAAHGPAVPQHRGRPDRQLPRPERVGGAEGLHGEYFKSQRFRKKDDRIIDRVDPTVQFDFGVNLPDASKGIGHRFAVRWEGSVLAPETGDYEFIVRTEHSARLWVNDPRSRSSIAG